MEVNTSWLVHRDEGKLGYSATVGDKVNIFSWGPCRDSFGVGEDVVLIELLLDQEIFSGEGYRKYCDLPPM